MREIQSADRSYPAPPRLFHERTRDLGIEFEEGDLEQFAAYLALLRAGNTICNLTSIDDPDDAWIRHVFDSLTLMSLLAELPSGARVIDVGSGGGAPALPLAIALPDLDFTLIESTGKKSEFLLNAAQALGLGNVRVISDRAETLGQMHKEHREKYDAATARALGPLRVASELLLPFVRVGGLALFIKGQRAGEELEEAKQAMHLLHAACSGVIDTPTGRIVVLEKLRPTPRLYPRRPGEPKRAPLGAEAAR